MLTAVVLQSMNAIQSRVRHLNALTIPTSIPAQGSKSVRSIVSILLTTTFMAKKMFHLF